MSFEIEFSSSYGVRKHKVNINTKMIPYETKLFPKHIELCRADVFVSQHVVYSNSLLVFQKCLDQCLDTMDCEDIGLRT